MSLNLHRQCRFLDSHDFTKQAASQNLHPSHLHSLSMPEIKDIDMDVFAAMGLLVITVSCV